SATTLTSALVERSATVITFLTSDMCFLFVVYIVEMAVGFGAIIALQESPYTLAHFQIRSLRDATLLAVQSEFHATCTLR
ncbi:hypothetical protein ACW07R_004056, partial [Klebsiella pneumoniae]